MRVVVELVLVEYPICGWLLVKGMLAVEQVRKSLTRTVARMVRVGEDRDDAAGCGSEDTTGLQGTEGRREGKKGQLKGTPDGNVGSDSLRGKGK